MAGETMSKFNKMSRIFNALPEETKKVVMTFEKYYAEVTRELLKLVSEVPELAKHINVPMTFLNFPEIILDEYLILAKEDYKKLRKLGYDIDVGCVGGCGYGYLEAKESDKYVEFEVIDCPCHPGAYFLVLRPTA